MPCSTRSATRSPAPPWPCPTPPICERAAQALEGRARPANLRLPDEPGLPVLVLARGRGEGAGFVRVYLDPQSGKVLEAGSDGGLVAWMHDFHEYLTLRQYSGREIVGAVGVAMLISSLSGIYLWWPGRGRMRAGLTTRRGFPLSRNIHYLVGFYGSLMLAMLSFTGIYLAFPDAGRGSVAPFAALSPPARNVQAPEAPPAPAANPAAAAADGKNAEGKDAPAVAAADAQLPLPKPTNARGEADGANASPAWREGRRGEGRRGPRRARRRQAQCPSTMPSSARRRFTRARRSPASGCPAGRAGSTASGSTCRTRRSIRRAAAWWLSSTRPTAACCGASIRPAAPPATNILR